MKNKDKSELYKEFPIGFPNETIYHLNWGRDNMKAKDLTGKPPGGQREILKDVLPLSTPYVVQIFPVYSCNLSCNFCLMSMPKKDRNFISDMVHMPWDVYRTCIEDLKEFDEKIRVLRIVGLGEPLLWKHLSDAVRNAKYRMVADKVEIITNGTLLNPNLSNKLIDAGLDRLVVSLQGVSKEAYKEFCNRDIDFDKFVSNLKYFYENKKDTHVYIKVADVALKNEDDKKRFYDIFGDIADSLAIEQIVPLHSEIEYSDEVRNKEVTQFGSKIGDVQVCPTPFTSIQLNPDGNVVPCYSWEYPVILGSIHDEDLHTIWNGKTFKKFRKKMIKNINNNEVCAKCEMIKYRRFEEDNLDHSKDKLKEIYK